MATKTKTEEATEIKDREADEEFARYLDMLSPEHRAFWEELDRKCTMPMEEREERYKAMLADQMVPHKWE